MNVDNSIKDKWFGCCCDSISPILQINKKELDNKSCRKFVKRTSSDALEQFNKVRQLIEQREFNKIQNRFKRNWKEVIGLTLTVIGIMVAILLHFL